MSLAGPNAAGVFSCPGTLPSSSTRPTSSLPPLLLCPVPRAVNTAINGNLVVKRREETTIRISDILDDVVANTKAIDKMKENAYL